MLTDNVHHGGPSRVDLAILTNQNVVANFLSVIDDSNNNLTAAQKELLVWYSNLAHSHFDWNQSLMRKKTSSISMDPIIKTSKAGASSCDTSGIMCLFCKMAKARRKHGHQTSHSSGDPILSLNDVFFLLEIRYR